MKRPAGDEDYRRYSRVYLLRCRATNVTKIGVSSNPWQRAPGVASICPTDVFVHSVIDAGEEHSHGVELERRLHSHFAASRVRGEWFLVEPRLVVFTACQMLRGRATYGEFLA